MKDEDFIKVTDFEEDEKLASKANKNAIFLTTATILAIIIIFVSCGYTKKAEEIIKANNMEISQEESIDNNNTVVAATYASSLENQDEATQEFSQETSEYKGKEIDYNNVSSFYSTIEENRNNFGEFAECFQSEEDVKNFINFIYSFDQLYSLSDASSTISSQKQYDEIIRSYYDSCVKNNIDGNLASLFKEDSYINVKLSEAERLTNNLRNGKGNDYTIPNEYYTWLAINLWVGPNDIKENLKNAPLIDLLREQYESYRNVGNMIEARKYQKNDSLPIDKLDVYYSYQYEDGIEVSETQNSFSCPDGVDNVISKAENVEETKHVLTNDSTLPFSKIDEMFEYVLGNGKVK